MSSSKPARREQMLTETVNGQKSRILSVIRKMVRDPIEAEDVLQDVMTEVIEAYDLGQTIETIGAWMLQVARNKVIDRFRRRKTQEEYRFLVESSPDASEASESENNWMQEWIRREIVEALEELPPEQRDVFVQHELEGKSFEEIAAETDTPINTLLSRKRYAVLALRKHLKEVYDEI